MTVGRLRSPKGACVVEPREVAEQAAGLCALWKEDPDDPCDLKDAFGSRLYALVTRHRRDDEPASEVLVRRTAQRLSIPTVAGNEVLYHTKARRPLQDVLTCIRHGVKLSDAGSVTRANAEHVLHAPGPFEALFDDDQSSVARTREVAERCRFGLGELR